jgi:prepilin-type N-terminal cleavage/methylation domain-containing protein/prepilin-type processing-associated H-X9-DG protein
MRKGFTLIELLVVIAIIAILAAILFPVFARARAKAQQNNCLSNTKQIQLGLIMYASDNNQAYPATGSSTAGNAQPDWTNAVYPYIKNVQIYLCPSDATASGTIPCDTTATAGAFSYGTGSATGVGIFSVDTSGASYGINTGLVNNADALILYPAEMLGIIDAGGLVVSASTTGYTNIQTGTLARHNNGSNQSYVDGHAKWIATTNIPLNSGVASSPNNHYWLGKD